MADRTRMEPADRKAQIVAAAVSIAKSKGYQQVRWTDIATYLGISRALPCAYFKTLTQLQRAIMRYAVKHGELAVIAQGLAANDSTARKADSVLKKRALDSVAA